MALPASRRVRTAAGPKVLERRCANLAVMSARTVVQRTALLRSEDSSDAFQYRGNAFLVRGEVDRAVDDLQTARMFGLTVPSSPLSRTDEINRFDPWNVRF